MELPSTEQANPASRQLDRLTAIEIAQLMNDEDARVAPAVASQLPAIAEAIELIATQIRNGGRLFYLGAGTSGRLGVLDASECPPTFQTPPGLVTGLIAGGPGALTNAIEGAEDRAEEAQGDLEKAGFSALDVLVGIASSGRTPYVLGGLTWARGLGAATIGLTCNPASPLQAIAERTIAVEVGPEVLTGSTRLKAGTATKLVLNMLSTGAMIRLGKTWGNLMVDLRASNQKLRERSVRIVGSIAGVDEALARQRLQQSAGEVKTAIVAERLQITPEEARERLRLAAGHLSAVLPGEEVPPPKKRLSSTDKMVLGVDAGGTKTAALLAHCAGQGGSALPAIVARALSGSGNPVSSRFEQATANIGRAVDEVLASAGMLAGNVDSVCIAVAGGGAEAIRNRLANWFQTRGFEAAVQIVDDVQPVLEFTRHLLRHRLPDVPRVQLALIGGTGSIAVGRLFDESGLEVSQVRSGGWGAALGDEGSGFAIGRALAAAVCQGLDGRSDGGNLAQVVLEHLGLQNESDWREWSRQPEPLRQRLAQLAPLAFEMASYDSLAAGIIHEAAEELAALIRAVRNRLGSPDQAWSLGMAGSLLVQQPQFRQLVLERIGLDDCPAPLVELVDDPVAGCLLLAAVLTN